MPHMAGISDVTDDRELTSTFMICGTMWLPVTGNVIIVPQCGWPFIMLAVIWNSTCMQRTAGPGLHLGVWLANFCEPD